MGGLPFEAETVQVKVTAWPSEDGSGEEARLALVVILLMVWVSAFEELPA